MNPLAALYGGVARARNELYDRGALRTRRLAGPVVSVGNLSVGGSGKTPFVIALGELLKERGIGFDVLSRGYGRATRGVALVDPAGSARDFGDEPLLIARKLRVPVIVGEGRFAAGLFAEQKFGPQLHLLDDGFQHRQLARDFDIVLITAADAQDALLPAGRLREPLSSLLRANVVVVSNNASLEGLPLGDQQVWRVTRDIAPPRLSGASVAFCGIARPDNFFAELGAAGITLSGKKAFADHHAYTSSDVRRLLSLRRQCGASSFVTTEKDAINLGPAIAELEPVHVVPLQVHLRNAGAAVDSMLARIAQRRGSST